MFIVGVTNCAKSLCLKPLRKIFKVYTIPDDGSHKLASLLDKELMFLNDFEWGPDLEKWMLWAYFKNFLEGEPTEVARPKTDGANVMFEKLIPGIGTCPKRIELQVFDARRKQVVVNEEESSQMGSRIHYIPFTHQITSNRIECEPCACCGAKLYLRGRPPALQPPQADVAQGSSLDRSRTPPPQRLTFL